jgi:hypothetical protein
MQLEKGCHSKELIYQMVQKKKTMHRNQVPVAHTCNPSYSGGRDQKDLSSKPAQANNSWDPILKNLQKNRAGGVAQVKALSSSPSTTKKTKQNKTKKKPCRDKGLQSSAQTWTL